MAQLITSDANFISSKFILYVQLYDRYGNSINDRDLMKLIQDNSFETDYLNEHLRWDAEFIKEVSIVSVPNVNTVIINIKHSNTVEDLTRFLTNFIERESPYHDYLNLFYEDEENYQCRLSIDGCKLEI